MLVCIPSTITKIQTTHESHILVDQTQFLVMSPVKNDTITQTIDTFESISTEFGSSGCVKFKALKR